MENNNNNGNGSNNQGENNQEDEGYFDSNLTSQQSIEEAYFRSGNDLENPQDFKTFMDKVKGMYSSMKGVITQVATNSQRLKGSGVTYSKTKIYEDQLGTGELNMGIQIAVAAPAKEQTKFDPQVPTRKGGGGGQGR